MGETLVVRFDIRDRKAAGVLWAAHAKGELIHGCKVTGLTWEDLFEKDILCIHEECEECHRELKWDQRTAEIEASKARNAEQPMTQYMRDELEGMAEGFAEEESQDVPRKDDNADSS